MRCKKIKENILTDYVDGNLKGDALREIESHLSSCPECRRLAEEARSAGNILKASPRYESPPEVWQAIRTAVSAGQERARFTESVLERLRFRLLHPRPAFVISTAVTLLLFALVVAYLVPGNGYLRDVAEEDDIFMISSINGGEEAGFGTPTEDLFL